MGAFWIFRDHATTVARAAISQLQVAELVTLCVPVVEIVRIWREGS